MARRKSTSKKRYWTVLSWLFNDNVSILLIQFLIGSIFIVKVTILVDGEDLDHDKALRDAIQAATNLNPNFEVEKLEIDHEESDH